jgi:hypothetical protein
MGEKGTMTSLAGLLEQHDRENAWIREWGIAEEDRARFTVMRWKPGEFRFFRARKGEILAKAVEISYDAGCSKSLCSR